MRGICILNSLQIDKKTISSSKQTANCFIRVTQTEYTVPVRAFYIIIIIIINFPPVTASSHLATNKPASQAVTEPWLLRLNVKDKGR